MGKDLVSVFLLMVAGVIFVVRIESGIDIALMDESDYLRRGVFLPEFGFSRGSWGPFYVLWYYFLSLFQTDEIKLFYLNFKIITIALPFLFYILLRRLHVPGLGAFVIALWLMVCSGNGYVWPKPWHFASILVLTGLIAATFTDDLVSALRIGLPAALIGSYVRPELFLAFLIIFIIYIIAIAVGFKSGGGLREIPFFFFIAGTSIAFISLFGFPLMDESNRGFFAFAQYFSVNWGTWTGSDANPMTNWRAVTEQCFGDATSLADAFIHNPSAFLRHVATNACRLPVHAAGNLFALASYRLHHFSREVIMAQAVTGFVLWCIWSFLSAGWSPRNWGPRIKKRTGLYVIMGCIFVPSAVSLIVIYPQDHYILLPALIAITAMAGVWEFRTNTGLRHKMQLTCLALLLVLCGTGFFPPDLGDSRVNLKTIEFIRTLSIQEKVALLEAEGGYHIYLGPNYRMVRHFYKRTGFSDFLKRKKINMIVMSTELRKDVRYAEDPEWKRFCENPAAYGFENMRVPGTENVLIVDKSLL